MPESKRRERDDRPIRPARPDDASRLGVVDQLWRVPDCPADVRNFVVGTHGWMTDQDFANIFAMAQSIPGPNMILMMSFIGWKV